MIEADVARLEGHLEMTEADAVVVLTDHDDVDYDMVSTYAHYVLYTRHRCVAEVVEPLNDSRPAGRRSVAGVLSGSWPDEVTLSHRLGLPGEVPPRC